MSNLTENLSCPLFWNVVSKKLRCKMTRLSSSRIGVKRTFLAIHPLHAERPHQFLTSLIPIHFRLKWIFGLHWDSEVECNLKVSMTFITFQLTFWLMVQQNEQLTSLSVQIRNSRTFATSFKSTTDMWSKLKKSPPWSISLLFV